MFIFRTCYAAGCKIDINLLYICWTALPIIEPFRERQQKSRHDRVCVVKISDELSAIRTPVAQNIGSSAAKADAEVEYGIGGPVFDDFGFLPRGQIEVPLSILCLMQVIEPNGLQPADKLMDPEIQKRETAPFEASQ